MSKQPARGSESEDGARIQAASEVLALLPVAIGALGLFAWATRHQVLVSWIPGHPAMGVVSSTTLILLGFSAYLCGRTGRQRDVGLLASALALGIALVTLVHHATGWGGWLDGFASRGYPSSPSFSPYLGWPTVIFAVAATLTAGALLLARVQKRGRPVVAAAQAVVFALAYVGITAHAYSGGLLLRSAVGRPLMLTLPAAVALALLSVAILLRYRGERSLAAVFGRGAAPAFARRFIVFLLAAPLALGLLVDAAAALGFGDLPTAFAVIAAMAALLSVAIVIVATGRVVRAEAGRREAEASLRANQIWLQGVIDQLPEGVVLLNGQGEVAWNRAALALSVPESARRDHLGNPILLDLRDGRGARVAERELPWLRAFDGEDVPTTEYVLRPPDGDLVPVRVRAVPLAEEGGGGAVAVVQDIRIDKELQRLREEWISLIAHDLRQPVTVLRLTSAMLLRERGTLATRTAALVDRVDSASQRLERMIGDLLDASRLEARRMQLRRERADLARLVREALSVNAPTFGGRQVRLEVREAPPPLSMDPDRVQQVLLNLVSNAAKYGFAGTPIVVTVDRVDGEAQVSVTNQGKGLAPEELARLFHRFYRAASSSEGPGGVGLGLYIARGLIEAHGGRIWAESRPGETTTFHFTLPLGAPAEAQAPLH